MSPDPTDLTRFLGQLHPVLLHLPIGFLFLLGCLEAIALLPGRRQVASGNVVILVLSFPAALATAVAGWVLAREGGYDPELLGWHRWSGVLVVVAVAILLVLQILQRDRLYRAALVATLGLVGFSGHLGGSLTHGADFLSRYAPAPLRPLLAAGPRKSRNPTPLPTPPAASPDAPVFAAAVEPMLRTYCVSCHGPEKAKGKLRVDTFAGLQAGGENGPVLKVGDSAGSSLVSRIRLEVAHDDHMPPEGKPQPSPEQVALLAWWIDSGAATNRTARELSAPEAILRQLTNASPTNAGAR